MAQSTRKLTMVPAPVRTRRHAPRRRRRGVGLAVLSGSSPGDPPPVVLDQAWARGARRMARAAAWALPAYALVYLWFTLAGTVEFGSEATGWSARVSSADYQRTQLLAGLGGWLLAMVAMVALSALLVGLRGRLLAGLGLLAGLTAAVLLLPQLGVTVFTARATGAAVADGDPAAAQVFAQAQGHGEEVAVAGVVLFSMAWLLFGLAVWRSRPLSRADGLLLVLAAPLLGVASLDVPMVGPLGALLLLAAGIGIAANGARALPGDGGR